MKQSEVEYLDGQISVMDQEPSTVAELIVILGSEEAVVDEVVANLRYRNRHPRIYKKVSAEIASEVPKREKSRKTVDGKEKVIYVSDIDHLREAFKVSPDTVTELVTKLGQSEPLYVKGERSGTGRISQAALDAANGMIAEGEERVEGVIKFIEETVPGYKVSRDSDGSVSNETLARAIQTLNKHLERTARQQTQALLASAGKT